MIRIQVIAWGDFDENTYVVGDDLECVVFDPGAPISVIKPIVGDRKVRAILLTHTHFDHIAGADELRDWTGAPLYAPIGEATGLEDPRVNLSALYGVNHTQRPAERTAAPGSTFELGPLVFTACDTAGHSPGHLAWKATRPEAERGRGSGVFVIAGDALFSGSIGRTDIPGASHEQLLESIRREFLTLPDDAEIYPGHGPITTVGTERRFNPFLV